MPRELKDFKYKQINTSLAQYKLGDYVGAIPNNELYQIILLRKRIGKEAFLVNLELIKDRYEKGVIGKKTMNTLI